MGVMSIREFNANVSAAVSRAEAGEVIEITRNNRTVAELRPKRGAHDVEWNEANKEMLALMRRGFSLGGRRVTAEDKYGDVDL